MKTTFLAVIKQDAGIDYGPCARTQLMHHPLADTWGRHFNLQSSVCGAKCQNKHPMKEEENHTQKTAAGAEINRQQC